MSLWARQQLFMLLAFLAFVFLVGGLSVVYLVYRQALVAASYTTTVSDALGSMGGALANALTWGALILAVGIPVFAGCALVSWRCNVRLREDAYHRDTMRALAAVVKANSH